MQKAIIQGLNEISERVVSRDPEGRAEPRPCHRRPHDRVQHGHATTFCWPESEYIGRSPFIPAVQNSLDIKARDLGLKINPAGYIHVHAYRGRLRGRRTTWECLIAEEPDNQDEMVLIIDIARTANCSWETGTRSAPRPADRTGLRRRPDQVGMRRRSRRYRNGGDRPRDEGSRYKVIARRTGTPISKR